MVELTVGYVAGAIAAAIFLARLWSPNVLTFILSGVLKDTNTAATWTAASAAFQRSHWSWALNSDSSKNQGVRKDVLILTWFITIMSFLISVAGIVTPLGLYEAFVASDKAVVPFTYIRDGSSFAIGTPERSSLSFNRICDGYYSKVPCPFTDTIAVVSQDAQWVNTTYQYGYQVEIPKILQEVYSSGTDNSTTISNFFDIEWRRYQTKINKDDKINNGSAYLIGSARVMESLALRDNVEPIEGLLVDSQHGGVGFRNHTVPLGFEHGVTWTEDHLFVEPETACVDTNLTIDFEVDKNFDLASNFLSKVVLTDRGGFVSLKNERPVVDFKDGHINPKLQERAYLAAWLTNYYTAVFYNVTNVANSTNGMKSFAYIDSTMNKQFFLSNQQKSGAYDSLSLHDGWADHLDMGAIRNDKDNNADAPRPTNPFGLTSSNFTQISYECIGTTITSTANITNVLAKCGIMRGIPKRVDVGSSLIFDAGSKWSQPLYACATAVKASIKTVTFTYNGTDSLEGLKVDKVEPKTYRDDRSKPLWGVEKTGRRFYIDEIPLIWGLLDSKYESHPNISTIRQEYLYLPGSISALNLGRLQATTDENLPASNFHKYALGGVYAIRLSDSGNGDVADYSGRTNMAQWVKWQNLSSSPETASKIPNLVFTDYAAAAVVGTKGIRGWRNSASENVLPVSVSISRRTIRYRLGFAVPAFLVLLGLIIMTVLAILTVIVRHHNIRVLRLQLQSLSPGRIFTTLLHPERGGMTVSSSDWSRTTGKTVIRVQGDYPLSTSTLTPPHVIGGAPGEKGPSAFETSVSEGSTERDQFLRHSSSPPIPQPYVGALHMSPSTPIPPRY